MSTKIYNAFKLPTTSFSAIRMAVAELREQALSCALQTIKAKALADALERFDLACLAGTLESEPRDFLGEAFAAIFNEIQEFKSSPYRNPGIDTSLSLCFFPRSKDTLGMAFADNPTLLELVKTLPGWQDYSYWNNTDRPDHVSAAQWSARRVAWNKALPGTGVPAEQGFTVRLLSVDSWMLSDAWDGLDKAFDLELPVGDFAKRVANHAVGLVVKSAMQNRGEDEQAQTSEPSVAAFYRAVRTATQLPEYPAALQEVRAKLRPQVRVRDLRAKA